MKRHTIQLICALLLLAAPPTHAHAKPERASVVLDPNGNVKSFYGVPVTLTLSGLKRLPFSVKKGQYSAEGNSYVNYTITALKGVLVVVEFDDQGTLHGAETVSPNAIALKGIGVGSSLADARKAWPDGTFLFGFADGEYVTYVTGTNVLLRFNPRDLPKGAFDHFRPYDFPVPDTIKVQKISVYPKPNPVSKGMALPDPNRNSSSATSNGKTIWTLDVERIPGSLKVRIMWTDRDKIVADRTIDVSSYPDFDIWTRSVIYDSGPVVISFRYGNFKDCSVSDDDRDKLYVTLAASGATISAAPPSGVRIWDDPAMPKSVGNSMNSSAHGCRRTYNPTTGAFGLERVQ